MKIKAKKISIYVGIVLGILAIGYYFNENYKILSSIFNKKPSIKVAEQNEKLILIANFNSREQDLDFDIRLKEAFNRAFWSSNVRVEFLDTNLQSEDLNTMWHQGKVYNATIVIGGRIDKFGIKPSLFLPHISPGKYDDETQEDFYYKAEGPDAIAAVELGLVMNNVSKELNNHALPLLTPQIEFTEIPASENSYQEIIMKDLPNSLIYLSKAVLGIIAYLEKDYRTAEYFLDDAINLTRTYLLWPLNIDNLFYYAGRSKLESKKYERAENYFFTALDKTDNKINRLRTSVYSSLIELRKNNYKKAKTFCELVLSENIGDGYYFTKSDRSNLYLYYARACYNLEEYEFADEYFSKLYELEENTSMSMLAELNFKIGLSKYFQENYGDAKPFLYRAYNTDTTNAQFLYWMGLINGINNNTDSCCYYLHKSYLLDTDSTRKKDTKNLLSKLGCL